MLRKISDRKNLFKNRPTLKKKMEKAGVPFNNGARLYTPGERIPLKNNRIR